MAWTDLPCLNTVVSAVSLNEVALSRNTRVASFDETRTTLEIYDFLPEEESTSFDERNGQVRKGFRLGALSTLYHFQLAMSTATPVECAGTPFWIPLSDLTKRKSSPITSEQWLGRIRTHCESQAFQHFCEKSGLQTPVFEWNALVKTEVLDRFQKECHNVATSCGDVSCSVSAVFHGTPPHNVKNILTNGLDPKKRNGQAYGPGEYFGKDPGTASSYCRGGKQMCVFLVIVPKEKSQEGDEGGTLPRLKPFEMIIVENNHHQLPIGVLKFSAVDAATLNASHVKKRKLQELNLKALEKENQAILAATKAKIIQLIIQRELESAAALYNRNKGQLTIAYKKEIGIYAFESYDEEFVSFYFHGGLPKPNQGHANEEFISSETRTVEELQEESKGAAQELDSEYKKSSSFLPTWRTRERNLTSRLDV